MAEAGFEPSTLNTSTHFLTEYSSHVHIIPLKYACMGQVVRYVFTSLWRRQLYADKRQLKHCRTEPDDTRRGQQKDIAGSMFVRRRNDHDIKFTKRSAKKYGHYFLI